MKFVVTDLTSYRLGRPLRGGIPLTADICLNFKLDDRLA